MARSTTAYFSPASFKFLRALARHNEREWFLAHKAEFETHLRQPMLQLIADLAKPLHAISPYFVASPRPQGGSMFRIYRDTRFARDKRPYKEWISARFFHQRSRELMGDAPFFYLHLQPGHCFIGGGVWHAQPATLKRIRAYLINNPVSWKATVRAPKFRRVFTLAGDSLVRPPQGYDPNHELIEDLKRKDFIVNAAMPDEEMLRPDLPKRLIRRFQQMAPLNDWLCGALDLDF